MLTSCTLEPLADFESDVVNGGLVSPLFVEIVSFVDSKSSVEWGVPSQVHGVEG